MLEWCARQGGGRRLGAFTVSGPRRADGEKARAEFSPIPVRGFTPAIAG
jgi:hypothetical protein